MKRNVLLLCITVMLFASAAKGQLSGDIMFDKDGRPFTIPRFHDYNLNLQPSATEPLINADRRTLVLPAADESFASPEALADLPLNVHVLSTAYAPFFNPYTPMMLRVSPFALDFSEAHAMPLGDKMALISFGRKTSLPLFGGQTDISTQLAWQHNNLTIAGGLFVGNYYTPIHPSPALTGGINLNARYQFSDKLALRGWGQYSLYGDNGAMNPWVQHGAVFNHTGLGGALEYMFNENFGLGGGVEYRFNYFKGRLEPHPVIYPIFRKGHFSIGVR